MLLTDGYIGREAAQSIGADLRRRGIRLIILAIGVDADRTALGKLADASGAQLLNVTDVAQLPRFARAAVDIHRARVQLGGSAVYERLALPFLPAVKWPPVTAYAVTRARPQSELYLVSDRDEPLLAASLAGRGRVVVLPAGLGKWTTAWQESELWPRLAGSLVEWSSPDATDPRLGLSVVEGAGISVSADLAANGEWSDAGDIHLWWTRADGLTTQIVAPAIGPGRYAATLSGAGDGINTVTAVAGAVRSTRTILHTAHQEADDFGINESLRSAVKRGLLRYCTPQALPSAVPQKEPPIAARRELALFGLVFWLVAVLIDMRSRWCRNFFRS